MLAKKEIIAVCASIVLMALVISFMENELKLNLLAPALIISAVIILISVFSKKITAKNRDVSVDIKMWEFRRYWFYKQSELKTPLPLGLLIPLLFAIATGGALKFFAFLQFEATALVSKAVKKQGQKRFSSMMEWDDALLVFYSIVPLLLLALIAKFLLPNFIIFEMLAKYSMIYSISNLIPISKLDGTKLFFGSIPLFVFTWILVIISGFLILL